MTEKPDFEVMYQFMNEAYVKLEKENEQLKKEIETCEAVEIKLEDRIDGLEQIIVILTKIYL